MKKSKRALVVLDVQNIYFDPESSLYVKQSKKILERINKLIRLFEERGELVIYTRHAHNPDGSDLGRMFDFAGEPEEPNFIDGTSEVELVDQLHLIRNAPVITKTRYSAFTSPQFQQLLDKAQIKRLVLCGFMTNFCCESTARDGHDRDYFVDFVIDATGCPPLGEVSGEELIRATAATLAEGFAVVITANEFS